MHMMNDMFLKARDFILTHARLLERRVFEVHFEGVPSVFVDKIVRAYQNPDGGFGHALEPDIRCPESQPIFAAIGLAALEEVGHKDYELALDICNYLQAVSDESGLVQFFNKNAYKSPIAGHWINTSFSTGLNPTADICGLIHFHGVKHEWLSKATNKCCDIWKIY